VKEEGSFGWGVLGGGIIGKVGSESLQWEVGNFERIGGRGGGHFGCNGSGLGVSGGFFFGEIQGYLVFYDRGYQGLS